MAQTEKHIDNGGVKVVGFHMYPAHGTESGEPKVQDTVRAAEVVKIRVAREEWQAACQAMQELQDKLRAFTHAARAELKVKPSCRNAEAWKMLFDLYCQQISRESQAAKASIYALAFSVETAAQLATFAELDTVAEADNE